MKLNRKFVEQAFRETVRFVERQSPTILTGLAAAGVVTTAIMAVRAMIASPDANLSQPSTRFRPP